MKSDGGKSVAANVIATYVGHTRAKPVKRTGGGEPVYPMINGRPPAVYDAEGKRHEKLDYVVRSSVPDTEMVPIDPESHLFVPFIVFMPLVSPSRLVGQCSRSFLSNELVLRCLGTKPPLFWWRVVAITSPYSIRGLRCDPLPCADAGLAMSTPAVSTSLTPSSDGKVNNKAQCWCDKDGPSRCSKCHWACYCSKEHQRADWSRHKLYCQSPAISESTSIRKGKTTTP
jgi:hypothetical protein